MAMLDLEIVATCYVQGQDEVMRTGLVLHIAYVA